VIEDGSSPPLPRHVVVSVDDAHLGVLPQVADSLRQRGMVVEHVMDGLGLITGTVPDDEHASLAGAVEGVVSVDDDLQHQLPPPDAPVQ
jgi:hypothetical protein